MAYFAYVHCKPNGHPFYVGKGNDRRIREIKRDNKFHQDVLKKYGIENILVGKFECSSEEIAYDLERGIIKCLRRMGVKLANQTDGGEGGAGWSPPPEVREKISKRVSGSGNPFFGRKHSEEEILRMSKRAREQWSNHELREKQSEIGKKKVGNLNPFFGKSHSDVTKRKISEAKRGKPGRQMTEEMRLDCSLRITGELHHFFGKKLSDKHKEKMSIGMRAAAIGCRFMFDGERKRRVIRDMIEKRLSEGWIFISDMGR